MSKPRTAILLPVTAMLLFWALTPISIAYIKNDFSLIFQIWLRYIVSTSALWLFLLAGKSLRYNFAIFMKSRIYFLKVLSVVAFCTIMFQLLYTWCFFLIPPGFGILLYQSQVIFSVLMGMLFFSTERQLIKKPGTVAGIVTALGGAALVIIFQNHGFSVVLNTGILLALSGALSWSLVGVTVKKWIGDRLTPLFTVTMVFTLVSIILTPVLFLSGPSLTGDPGLIKWSVLIGSGLLGIAGGQGLVLLSASPSWHYNGIICSASGAIFYRYLFFSAFRRTDNACFNWLAGSSSWEAVVLSCYKNRSSW